MNWFNKLFNKNSDKIDVSDSKEIKDKSASSHKSRKKSNRVRSNSLVIRQKMQKKIAESAKERVLDRRRSHKPSLEHIYEKEFNNKNTSNDSQTSVDEIKFDFRKIDQHDKHQQDRNLTKHTSINQPILVINNKKPLNTSSVQVNKTESDSITSDSFESAQSMNKENKMKSKFNDQNGYEKKSKSSDKSLTKFEEETIEQPNDQSAKCETVVDVKEETTSFDNRISRKEHQLNYPEQPELFSYRSLNSPNFTTEQNSNQQNSKVDTKNLKNKSNKNLEKENRNMSIDQMRNSDHYHQRTSIKNMSEDSCAINELLEGRMDLQVIVPAYLIKNQKVNTHTVVVLINVERRTPMLDLLIQIGNRIKFNVNDYKIVVIDELRNNYKANTPIGSLDVNQIQIVPKTAAAIALDKEKLRLLNLANQSNQQKSISTFNKLVQNSNLNSQQQNGLSTNCSLNGTSNSGSGTIPFQTTFRLQVNLPYNQRMVFRVTPTTTIKDVKDLVCEEKELNENKYQLVIFADLKQQQHPQILELDRTLAFYAVNEVSLISNKILEQMQMQNEISRLNNQLKLNEMSNNNDALRDSIQLNGKLSGSLTTSLNSIVNSQSTAASTHRKAIISLLSATNQLETNCDYSNNICTKNKCVCNLSTNSINSMNGQVSSTAKNCQKRLAKSESSACSNKINKIRRKKAPAPAPPGGINQENQSALKRSISNNSFIIERQQSINNREQKSKTLLITGSKNQITQTKQRHNSGSDSGSSGYHECLSTSNSPNNHQFGGSMINLSNNSLTVSPILEHQRLTSTPSSKQYRSSQQLNYLHKKRKAPSPPTGAKQPTLIEQSDSIKDNESKENNEKHKNEEIVEKNEKVATTKTINKEKPNSSKNDQDLEKKKEKIDNNNSSKKNLNSNSSFKSEASSGHSSGLSSSNSPDLQNNKDDEIGNENQNCTANHDSTSDLSKSLSTDQHEPNKKDLKLSNLAKENLENRFINSKSPTSVASEPIYLQPKSYFSNQISESTNSIVMLNLDEVRPSSAPNYRCEEEKINSTTNREQQLINSQIQSENSKDSGIFLKDNVTVNGQQMVSNSKISIPEDNNKEEQFNDVIDHAKVQKESLNSSNKNVTTLIINLNGDLLEKQSENIESKQQFSISALIENGDIMLDDHTPTKNTSKFMKQAPGSTGNIAPASYAMKSDENKQETKKKLNEESFNQPKSRISNLRDQFEQSTSVNTKPKIKLTNFKIGSYSTNHAEEDIYSDHKTSYSLENARQTAKSTHNTTQNQRQPYFRYLSSPVEMVQNNKDEQNLETTELNINLERPASQISQEPSNINKPCVPIKKPNLNAIKFKEVSLNEGLSSSVTKLNKLNNGTNHHKEMDNYNSDEFNDNQEFPSLYSNDNLNGSYLTFNYPNDRTIHNLLNNNLSMITPQPYKSTRAVPRKLFFGRESSDNKINDNDFKNLKNQIIHNSTDQSTSDHQTSNDMIGDSKILTPPPMPKSINILKSNSLDKSKEVQNEHSSLKSSNSFKEKNTHNYLVSDLRKSSPLNQSSNNVNNLTNSSKLNLSDCHDSLMDEIRAFGGKNSLKKVYKTNKEFEINF